jgi:hypothetical protein
MSNPLSLTSDTTVATGNFTPGALDDLANAINAQIEQLWHASQDNGPKLDNATYEGFVAFYNEWQDYYSSLQGLSGYVKEIFDSTRDALVNYQQRALAWTQQFAALGAAPAGPAPTDQSRNPAIDKDNSSSSALIFALVIIAVIVVALTVRKVL